MFDLVFNVHLNRVDAIFFSFTCAAVPKLKTKIYLSFLFTLLSIFMFGFFSRNHYNPLFYVYYLLICFCCSVLFLLSNTRYSLRSFFVHLFLTCKCVCLMCIYGSVCVCVSVYLVILSSNGVLLVIDRIAFLLFFIS